MCQGRRHHPRYPRREKCRHVERRLTKTGNEMGLTEAEINALPAEELRIRLQHTHDRMLVWERDYAAESITEVPAIVRKINSLLYQSFKPRK